ncbi:MAG: hypothetical protein WA137_02990 [Methanothrix sp.]
MNNETKINIVRHGIETILLFYILIIYSVYIKRLLHNLKIKNGYGNKKSAENGKVNVDCFPSQKMGKRKSDRQRFFIIYFAKPKWGPITIQ